MLGLIVGHMSICVSDALNGHTPDHDNPTLVSPLKIRVTSKLIARCVKCMTLLGMFAQINL